MAISRHKVLSEMQQQLELASSKCGNLQKQLEIVKDKVRQSSTTNLVQKEPPEEKENKLKNGDVHGNQKETERNQEYQHAMSLSSSSTEDVNEERDVNIIKVFYDRLGQMDYPTGHVELSDISSEENDLDIDQLLSSVNFSIGETQNDKRKEKRSDKKAKEKIEKTHTKKKSKGKPPKGPYHVSPYESHLMGKKSSPLKIKNQKNRASNVAASINSSGLGSATHKSNSRGKIPKLEVEKSKRRRQASGAAGVLTKDSGKRAFQDPIKRVMNLAGELRKTKSSTGAEKKDLYFPGRSLTRLHSDPSPAKSLLEARRSDPDTRDIPILIEKFDTKEAQKSMKNVVENIKTTDIGRSKQVAQSKGPVRVIRNDAVPKKIQEIKLKKEAPPKISTIMKDKGTSLSDLARVNKKILETENNVTTNLASSNPGKLEPSFTALKNNTDGKVIGKRFGGNISAVMDNKIKQGTVKNEVHKPKIVDHKLTKVGNDVDKPKNGITSHLLPPIDDVAKKSDVRRKVNIFESTIPASKESTEVTKKGGSVNERPIKSRSTALTITRTNSRGTLNEDSSRSVQEELRRFPSVNHLPSVVPVIRGESKDQWGISQIRRMKDNLMKFNAIPFIVGQSTTKSYHIGLNIQQTYSLFKQTPSITALKVSKIVDNDQHSIQSRGRSTRTGYSGRSMSTVRGRDTCPACGPAPDPSPEQLADPWAVPQDEEGSAIRVCTCLPKRIISFDQVLNQLYFTDMNLLKLHPSLLPTKEGVSEENEEIDGREKSGSLPHRGTNTLHYTKLLRSIQNLKDNILG
ncbi:hypothetical protein GE061_017444 [Apolygus lucorum]|uniref:Uncharacterized protein n=1 Tax=Apolygus lucorum TaxID=248454 RepID=A0A6A4JFS7_APOLU|nr:hypothetical protein GE061_017444 [Apolygus lucorum]